MPPDFFLHREVGPKYQDACELRHFGLCGSGGARSEPATFCADRKWIWTQVLKLFEHAAPGTVVYSQNQGTLLQTDHKWAPELKGHIKEVKNCSPPPTLGLHCSIHLTYYEWGSLASLLTLEMRLGEWPPINTHRSWRRHTQASATFGALECLSELSRVVKLFEWCFSIRKSRVDKVCMLWRSSINILQMSMCQCTLPYHARVKNVVKTCSSLAMSTRRQLGHALRSLPSCCFLVTCPSLALRRSHILSRMGSDHVGGIRSWGIRFRVIRITSGCFFFVCFWISKVQTRNISTGWPANLL